MIKDCGNLLNQNIRLLKVIEHVSGNVPDVVKYKLINTINDMELAVIETFAGGNEWINPGVFMTKEEYDKARIRKELHKINAEMIQNEK